MTKNAIPNIPNVVAGTCQEIQAARTLPLTLPATGEVAGLVPMSNAQELERTVVAAEKAQKDWAQTPLKDRVQVLFRLKHVR